MNNTIINTKMLIIGAGPAGYTAGIYAARANLSPIITTGIQPGGQLTITTDVENYPGYADVIQGPWLMEQMRLQAEHVGCQIDIEYIIDVDVSKRPFIASSDSGKQYHCETIVIATGAQARWLGLESETKFQGFGVSACATCDGFFFRGKKVCVIGGGNSAVEEALYLTNHAEHVYLIHRRDQLRCEKILEQRLLAHEKITPLWNQQVIEICGDDNPKNVTHIMLESTRDKQQQKCDVEGVFVAIGHDPATSLFKGKLNMDDHGYIITKADSTQTSIAGIYAAGDVSDSVYRQAVTAAGRGCMAALEAEKLLSV